VGESLDLAIIGVWSWWSSLGEKFGGLVAFVLFSVLCDKFGGGAKMD